VLEHVLEMAPLPAISAEVWMAIASSQPPVDERRQRLAAFLADLACSGDAAPYVAHRLVASCGLDPSFGFALIKILAGPTAERQIRSGRLTRVKDPVTWTGPFSTELLAPHRNHPPERRRTNFGGQRLPPRAPARGGLASLRWQTKDSKIEARNNRTSGTTNRHEVLDSERGWRTALELWGCSHRENLTTRQL
jgi:hypothetical protein